MHRLVVLLGISGCLPSGGPPEGSLRGTFATDSIDLALDEDSLYWLQRRVSCATRNQDIFALHYGAGQIEIYFQLDGGSTILNERTFGYPQDSGSNLVWLGIKPSTPALATATLVARIQGLVTTRRTGTIDMTFSDGGTLDATYDMPYEVQGDRTDCGDGLDVPDD